MIRRAGIIVIGLMVVFAVVACGTQEGQGGPDSVAAAAYDFHDRYQEFEPDGSVEPAVTRQQAIDAAVEKVLDRIGYPDIPEVRDALDISASVGLYWGYVQQGDRPVSEQRSEWPVRAREVWLVEMRNLPEFDFFYDPGPSRDREGPPIAAYVVGAQSGAVVNSEGRGEGEARNPEAWQAVQDLMEAEAIPWPTNEPPSGPTPTPTTPAGS